MLFIVSVLVAVVSLSWFISARKKFREEKNQMYQMSSNLAGVVFLVFAVVALSRMVAIIPPGHVGVVVLFGSTSETTLKSGINTVNPFADVIEFSVRTEEMKEVMGLLGVSRLDQLDKSYIAPAQPTNLPGVHSAFPLLNLHDEGY